MLAELHDIVAALDKDEFVPFFQPKVELRSGAIMGFEVLARWQHPLHGSILPSNAISLAEDSGIIGAFTQQIFRKAFLQAAVIPKPLTLSVNISPIQLCYTSLPGQIHELATVAGFSLDRVIIEITESALLKDLKCVKAIAGELKAMGCRLSLDDFGTGYSSLSHLQTLPFDELKIDRRFIQNMTRTRDSRKIVASIVGLGHSLGLTTVAEGVETEEQAHMLLWLGCEQGQGWRYGRPTAGEDLPAVLAAKPLAALAALSTPGEDWAASTLEALPTLRLAQLQAIYEGAPVGLCFLDCKFRYLSLNQQLAEMNGHPIEEHIGRSLPEMYPAWFELNEPYLLRAQKGEAITGVEIPRPVPDPDDPSLLLASYQPAWDEADEVIGISISLLDISKHAGEEMLGESAVLEELQPVINPEVPWVMDAEGNNLQVSARWVRTTPLGRDRTRNLRWLEALHPEDLERTIQTMGEALRTGHPIDIEYRIADHRGSWRWMRSTGSPRFSAAGEITRWYGSVEDIHEHKQKQEAIAG
jgi:PAS domain S-box-containing protein